MKKPSKYIITTDSPEDSEWKSVIIDGEKTCYVLNKKGELKNTKFDRMLNTYTNNAKTYPIFSYKLRVNTAKCAQVAKRRLMGCLFIPIPDDLKIYEQNELDIVHIDGDTTNFDIDNLKWVWYLDDVIISKKCIKPSRRKVKPELVIQICEMLSKGGKSIGDIAKELGIDRHMVTPIYYREAYDDISKNYSFDKAQVNSIYDLEEERVRNICEMLQRRNMAISKIAKIAYVHYTMVKRIKYRDIYTDISKDYRW